MLLHELNSSFFKRIVMRLRGFECAIVAVAAGLLTGVSVYGQAAGGGLERLHLMPLPSSVQMGQGELVLDASFSAAIEGRHDARLDAAFDRFVWRLDRQCGGIRRAMTPVMVDGYEVVNLATGGGPNSGPLMPYQPGAPALRGTFIVRLKVAGPGGAVQGVDEDESYKLIVTTGGGAQLSAATDVGAMHGMETLLQLVEMRDGACRVPAVTIEDAPRFQWRGLHLDVSRHFETVDVIKRTLDGMAVAKLNVFHWHLSDDQGFRAESKKFPKFTEVASDGLFYTQEQMRTLWLMRGQGGSGWCRSSICRGTRRAGWWRIPSLGRRRSSRCRWGLGFRRRSWIRATRRRSSFSTS